MYERINIYSIEKKLFAIKKIETAVRRKQYIKQNVAVENFRIYLCSLIKDLHFINIYRQVNLWWLSALRALYMSAEL